MHLQIQFFIAQIEISFRAEVYKMNVYFFNNLSAARRPKGKKKCVAMGDNLISKENITYSPNPWVLPLWNSGETLITIHLLRSLSGKSFFTQRVIKRILIKPVAFHKSPFYSLQIILLPTNILCVFWLILTFCQV